MPNSSDCAPCDYFLWGYLKRALNRRKVRTIQGLKKCISEELKKVLQIFINRALDEFTITKAYILKITNKLTTFYKNY